MYTKLIDQIESAFYEGFSDSSFRKHGKGYVGPLEIVDNESYYIVTKVIVGFESAEITANVRKSILKVFVNDEKEKPTDVVSLKLDTDCIDASKISSKLKNGILEIKLPKSENSKTVQISVE
jgi:HSP20 family molecular chaperone IbpA|tara:strand:+ start:6318 stop:6683 length:366 start_codon:yes stop_codon:yes gene_type:complete